MILVSSDYISGKELETLGLVKGGTIQSVNAFRDIGAGLKTLVGGELTKYTEMMNDARALATKRMVQEAEALGADAIVAVRYSSSAVMQGAAEVLAYGTAAKFVDCFDYNPLSQIALPLLIQSQIRGIGFALACDLLKELGYENYPKPDVHLMDVFSEIGLCEKNQMSVFLAVRQMAEACKQVDKLMTAYKVDKTFWLICSGLFYNEEPVVRIGSHKKELIELLKQVVI